MNTVVDVAHTPGNLAQIEKDLSEAVVARGLADTKVVDDKKTVSDDNDGFLPEKLRGKSIKDIADMYQNLESAHGRMANDLGTQRQLTDRLLDLKRAEDLGRNNGNNQPKKVDITPSELLERPTEALEKFVSARETPLVRQVEDRLNQVEARLMENQFMGRHPDVNTVAKSAEFNSWVAESRTRQRAAALAARGDYGAADDLLSEFKNRQQQTGTSKVADQKGNLEAARAASLESGASKSEGGGGKATTGKQYSRADLMRLRIEKPETYYSDEYQNEILQAYADGRVK